MPVKTEKRGDKYRVVEADTGRISKTDNGRPRDGGGHGSRTKCNSQVRAINSSRHK